MSSNEGPRLTSSQELQAFEQWRHQQADALERMGYPDGAAAFLRLGSVQWAGWQARAALDTLPAAREPVAWADPADLAGDGYSHVFTVRSEQPCVSPAHVPLYTDPPAAARGDDAVEVIATLEVHDYFPNSGVSMPDLQFTWAISPGRIRELVRTLKEPIRLVAMRAQAQDAREVPS